MIENKAKKKDEDSMEKFIYGHPTINGKETVYGGKKTKKRQQKEEPENTYDLRTTHNFLSNILQKQMEKNRKIMENDEDDLQPKKVNKENNNIFSNSNNLINNINNNINNNTPSEVKKDFSSSIISELEREVERANKSFSDREKLMNNQLMNQMSQMNQINNQANPIPNNKPPDRPLVKRKRGRPPKNPNNTINNSISNTISDPNANKNVGNNTQNNTLQQNGKEKTPPKKKNYYMERKERERLGLTPKKIKKNKSLFNGSYYGGGMDDNENNDMNLLEILFKEYGYNNIIYVLTDSPEIKLGENKIKKIKSGLNSLLGFDNNISKVVETIVNMRKSNLIDENWIKGKYNYRTRNKNNYNITSFHYQLNSDGYIYKFKTSKILHDGSIKFNCCDPKCHGRGILYPRIKIFKLIERHNLAPLQHDYMKNGYDKFQFKMENKEWKEISLKNNPDDKKCYIDWHKPYNKENVQNQPNEEK